MEDATQKELLIELEQMAIELDKWKKTPLGKYVMRSLDTATNELAVQVNGQLSGEQLIRLLSQMDGIEKARDIFEYPIRMKKEGEIDRALKLLSGAADSQETT